MKYFFRPKTAGQKRGQIFRDNGARSHTVPIAFGQGGIAILWLKFATGSICNRGTQCTPNLGQILHTFLMPPKNTRSGRESFPREGILSPKVRRGWPPPPSPISPQKIFEGGRNSKFWPQIPQKLVVRFSWDFRYRGKPPTPSFPQNYITDWSYL